MGESDWMSIKPIEVPDVFPKKLLGGGGGGGGLRGPNKKINFGGGGGGISGLKKLLCEIWDLQRLAFLMMWFGIIRKDIDQNNALVNQSELIIMKYKCKLI